MTPENQRIKIAETCGTLACPGCEWETLDCSDHEHKVPDYLNSLDAMHEAEKVLKEHQRNDYLLNINGRHMGGAYGTGPSFYDWWKTTRATAAQRAEAFLRTLNQWTDNQTEPT